MLGELAGMIARDIFLDRVDNHIQRREERSGPLGAPIVTLVCTIIGTIVTVAWTLLERRDSGGMIWPAVVVGIRLVLVLVVAYSLRLSRITRRRWVYFGVLLAEGVNLFAILADGISFVGNILGRATLAIFGGGADVSKHMMWVLIALTGIGLVADVIIQIALLIRRRMLD